MQTGILSHCRLREEAQAQATTRSRMALLPLRQGPSIPQLPMGTTRSVHRRPLQEGTTHSQRLQRRPRGVVGLRTPPSMKAGLRCSGLPRRRRPCTQAQAQATRALSVGLGTIRSPSSRGCRVRGQRPCCSRTSLRAV